MHADAVQRAGVRELMRHEPMMHGAGAAGQRKPRGFLLAGRVVQAHLDAGGRARLDGEVDAVVDQGRAQNVRRSGLHPARLRNTAASGGRRMRNAYGNPCTTCANAS